MVSMDTIHGNAVRHLYPRHVLEGCETALVLFAAAFHGAQDAIWIADAGLTATCVDTDQFKLMQMEDAYPGGWEFVCADAFEYTARTDRSWDVVSIDSSTNLFDRCAEMLGFWTLLARKVVVLGTDNRPLDAPEGWSETERRYRSNFLGGVYWAVFER